MIAGAKSAAKTAVESTTGATRVETKRGNFIGQKEVSGEDECKRRTNAGPTQGGLQSAFSHGRFSHFAAD